ncbi:hypothetical protein [Alkalimonas amylolytica]|uniref:SatD family (SatD) n=1 Tax=Alkalimonas amylolytica TaxID=152573 RepID=A0A1H4BTJ2_ALKAM|nr:hypothetical protein [Alkalimonas amylolytica]SEA51418.1 hypothetical protein SAMN04488051_103511 [Alkalimonas amylolytica]
MPTSYAVLTGDLVQSRAIKAVQYDSVLYQLEQLFASQVETWGLSYNFYRGDAFQLLLTKPQYGVQLAISIRLTLLSLAQDCKISIGIGEVTNLRQDIKSATGPAFTLSGTGLDSLSGSQRLQIHCQQSELQAILAVPVRMADAMVANLTARQAEAVLLHLINPGLAHEAIAQKLGTSRANVTKLLNNSHVDYQLLQAFLIYCEQHICRSLPS